jgi:hypothetical protein
MHDRQSGRHVRIGIEFDHAEVVLPQRRRALCRGGFTMALIFAFQRHLPLSVA